MCGVEGSSIDMTQVSRFLSVLFIFISASTTCNLCRSHHDSFCVRTCKNSHTFVRSRFSVSDSMYSLSSADIRGSAAGELNAKATQKMQKKQLSAPTKIKQNLRLHHLHDMQLFYVLQQVSNPTTHTKHLNVLAQYIFLSKLFSTSHRINLEL